ncbi:lysosomal Pro-X carboxypeptidase-like [Abrus precatorius]|uniref:Lysosomal Pro-X carboxypeptidase-like n=1 Tax=Abrus precatorius TaxID=3816 RepID=A0A8B8KHS9_ABRPR|nr:lysosomal Pro-X carboxypeptidase-like [Abrus precatorius]
MGSTIHSFQWLSLFFLIISANVSAFKIPRLGTSRRTKKLEPQIMSSSQLPEDLKTFYYTQRLDHFNYKPDSYTTFQQRYMINFKYWGGAKSSAPIFAFFGAEAPVDEDIYYVGFLRDNAPQFNALIVYIEHRYYGKSIPFGSRKEAMRNASTRGYFNSAQAIADYAAVLLHIKKTLSAQNSPIIVIGGSYGGMLASWFRLKYPHIALGALASSAPILYFNGIAPQAGYYYIVTKDFKETSDSCYQTIRKSWSEIDRVAKKPNGLSILSKRFKTCNKLNKSFELKDYLDSLYTDAAQYNQPPEYPVKVICDAIDAAAAAKKTDILGQIFEGVVAYMRHRSCYDMNEYNHPTETNLGWRWQTCSEMVMPIGHERNDSMFPPAPFNMKRFVHDCWSLYGVLPQPHWVTTYYGGPDLKLILHRFASNIIFSNGLRDPYSSGGVLESISRSVIAVSTVNGSHCLDILSQKPSDPQWLVTQRNIEVKIIKGWIAEYQADLLALNKQSKAPIPES